MTKNRKIWPTVSLLCIHTHYKQTKMMLWKFMQHASTVGESHQQSSYMQASFSGPKVLLVWKWTSIEVKKSSFFICIIQCPLLQINFISKKLIKISVVCYFQTFSWQQLFFAHVRLKNIERRLILCPWPHIQPQLNYNCTTLRPWCHVVKHHIH